MTLSELLEAAGVGLLAFLYMGLTFAPLEHFYPRRPSQGFLRPRWGTDLAFFTGQYLVFAALVVALLFELSPWLHSLVPPPARRAFSRQPWLLQWVEVILAGDLAIYWAHRAQHRFDCLWRFHSVHHTAEHLDWLAAHREHPLDSIYSVFFLNMPAFLIGLPLRDMAQFMAFRGIWAIFIHSNVRVDLGPLGLLFGSPAYHQWHHAQDRGSVNFGNVSPLMDVLFGTHYDPGYDPPALGLAEPGARGYLGLMLNPLLPRSLAVGLAPPD